MRKGEVVAYSLKIGDYIVTKYENEEVTAEKGTQVALNTEAKKIEDAKTAALTRVTGLLNGNTNSVGIFEYDIEGSTQKEWIAKLNDEVIGYSVKVESNGTNYIVTKNGDAITVEEITGEFNIGDKTASENQIINYYKGLATTKLNTVTESLASSTVKASVLTSAQTANDDVSLKMSEISGVASVTGLNTNSWAYYAYTSGSPASVTLTDYSIEVTEGGYTFVANMIGGTVSEITTGSLSTQKSVSTAVAIYYNPITGELNCTTYHEDNSKAGFNGITEGASSKKTTDNQTSCLKWYKYSENADGTVNMILDHNTSVGIKWYTSDNNSMAAQTVLTQLRTDTSGWEGVPVRTDSYTASWKTSSSATEPTTTTIDYSTTSGNTYRARLITAQEVADIVGKENWDEHTSVINTWFYFGSLNQTQYSSQTNAQKARQRKYAWLFDNLYDSASHGGTTSQTINGNYGYWTSSPSAGSSSYAWIVRYDGDLDRYDTSSSYIGVRPVITISES